VAKVFNLLQTQSSLHFLVQGRLSFELWHNWHGKDEFPIKMLVDEFFILQIVTHFVEMGDNLQC